MSLQRKKSFKTTSITLIILTGAIFGYAKANDAYLERHIDYPKHTLLANGSFEDVDDLGKPHNWSIKTSGPSVGISKSTGYHNRNSFHVEASNYHSGNIAIESDKITVSPNQNYFFKTYAKTNLNSDLLIHYFYTDGTEKYELAEHYPAVDEVWSTMSTSLRTDNKTTGISMAIHTFGNGYIDLDNAYFIATDNSETDTKQWETANSIPNPDLDKQINEHQPADWLTYSSGDNKVGFEYKNEGTNHYQRLTVSDYRSGEAKWQYLPLAVIPHQSQKFEVDYRSDAPVDVIVEYEFVDGSRRFSQITELHPTSVWTHVSTQFETIAQAQKMFVSLVMHRNGYVDSDNYSLVPSKPSNVSQTFHRPLISLTFDDGWLSQFTEAEPLLKQHNVSATFYINSSTIGTNGFITLGQLKDLQNNGHHIASHGHQHLDITSMSVKAFQDQLTRTKKYLEDKIEVKTIDYASPFGKHNSQTDAYVRSLYASHRSTDTGINTNANFDRYNMKVLFIRDNSDLQFIRDTIEETKASNGWLILVYHQFDVTNNRNAITTEQFNQHLQAIQSSEIPVVTVRQALEEIEK